MLCKVSPESDSIKIWAWCERLYMSLVSASRPFVEWIEANVRRLTGLNGVIGAQRGKGRRVIWLLPLRHARVARSSPWDVLAPDVARLECKRAKAAPFTLEMR